MSNIPDIKFICPVKIFNRWLHFTDRFILKFAVKFLLKLTKRSTGNCHASKGAGRGMNLPSEIPQSVESFWRVANLVSFVVLCAKENE